MKNGNAILLVTLSKELANRTNFMVKIDENGIGEFSGPIKLAKVRKIGNIVQVNFADYGCSNAFAHTLAGEETSKIILSKNGNGFDNYTDFIRCVGPHVLTLNLNGRKTVPWLMKMIEDIGELDIRELNGEYVIRAVQNPKKMFVLNIGRAGVQLYFIARNGLRMTIDLARNIDVVSFFIGKCGR